jgi:hypothetical protein
MKFDFSAVPSLWPPLLQGLQMTRSLALVAALTGTHSNRGDTPWIFR